MIRVPMPIVERAAAAALPRRQTVYNYDIGLPVKYTDKYITMMRSSIADTGDFLHWCFTNSHFVLVMFSCFTCS